MGNIKKVCRLKIQNNNDLLCTDCQALCSMIYMNLLIEYLQ